MGRKTTYQIGQFFGKLEILKILPSIGSGNHVKLKCLCHYCNSEKIMNGANIKRRNSCGCQQKNSSEWKRIGAKNRTWQLPEGQAAKNNVEYQYRRAAEKRGLEFDLNSEEFEELVTGKCIYCGDALTNIKKGQGKTSGDFNYTGIDRIDSSKGYTLENSVSCCWTCNNMKHTHNKADFLNHVRKIFQHNNI